MPVVDQLAPGEAKWNIDMDVVVLISADTEWRAVRQLLPQ